eukprot:4479083-Pyramimonas_sp.AAC.1
MTFCLCACSSSQDTPAVSSPSASRLLCERAGRACCSELASFVARALPSPLDPCLVAADQK